jgi:hypothetical protein
LLLRSGWRRGLIEFIGLRCAVDRNGWLDRQGCGRGLEEVGCSSFLRGGLGGYLVGACSLAVGHSDLAAKVTL